MVSDPIAGLLPNMTSGKPPPPRAILFDWDGTLVDTHPVLATAMNEALRAFEMAPWSYEKWSAWLGKSAEDAFPNVFGDDWNRARQVYLDAYSAYHLQKLELKPGAGSLVQALVDLPVYLGVVSNKTGDLLRCEVEHLQWGEHFGHVIGAGDSARDKPAPDPIFDVLAPGGHATGPDVWFVGDNAVDVTCGHDANCTTILVGEVVSEIEPDHRVTDLGALESLVLSALDRS